jgi:hypothetical protein
MKTCRQLEYEQGQRIDDVLISTYWLFALYILMVKVEERNISMGINTNNRIEEKRKQNEFNSNPIDNKAAKFNEPVYAVHDENQIRTMKIKICRRVNARRKLAEKT